MIRYRAWLGFITILLISASRAAGVVELRAESTTVSQPGDVGDICIVMNDGGVPVAGTQNDLVWDRNCANLPSSSSCRINPATGKQLQGAFPPQFDFAYRALVLSLTDVDPIPNGQLYCCAFEAEADPGDCCEIRVVRAVASDPLGRELAAAGNTAQLCVAGGDGTPRPTATPIPGEEGDGGCQVGGADPVSAAWLVSGLLLIGTLRRRSRASR